MSPHEIPPYYESESAFEPQEVFSRLLANAPRFGLAVKDSNQGDAEGPSAYFVAALLGHRRARRSALALEGKRETNRRESGQQPRTLFLYLRRYEVIRRAADTHFTSFVLFAFERSSQ